MASLVVITVVLSASSAYGTIDTTVYAVGDSIEVTAVVTVGTGYAGKSIVVLAQLIGANDEMYNVAPDSLPIAMTDETQVMRFRFRPQEPERFYNYMPVLGDEFGGVFFFDKSPCTQTVFCVSLGEAVAFRGRLYSQGETCVRAERCDNSWAWATCGLLPDDCEFEMDDTLRPYVDTGQIVDLYANSVEGPTYAPCAPPGTPCMDVTRVEAVTHAAGCSTVEESQKSWGWLKSTFR